MGIADTNVTAGLGQPGHAAQCLTLNLAKHFSTDAVPLLFQRKGQFLTTTSPTCSRQKAFTFTWTHHCLHMPAIFSDESTQVYFSKYKQTCFLATKVLSIPDPENCWSGVISSSIWKYTIKPLPLAFINWLRTQGQSSLSLEWISYPVVGTPGIQIHYFILSFRTLSTELLLLLYRMQ